MKFNLFYHNNNFNINKQFKKTLKSNYNSFKVMKITKVIIIIKFSKINKKCIRIKKIFLVLNRLHQFKMKVYLKVYNFYLIIIKIKINNHNIKIIDNTNNN